jgi:preprotein translocase subunit SecG
MTTVLLLIHLLIAVALIGVVLLQRSEGGGLGIGGGGSSGFMTGRGTANLLTRATAGLAAAFFVTSIGLDSLDQGKQRLPSSIPKSD